jgi:ribosomal protein S18 acetylase RimI-like enzyme
MKASASSVEMQHDVRIRRAHAPDVPELMAICAEHADFEQLPHVPGERAAALAGALDGDTPRLMAWLACIGDAVVGYASATVDFSTLDRVSYLHMDCLYVRAPWRNHAIGRQLWEHVIAHASAQRCASVQWQTPAWNDGAARFYRRLGANEHAKLRYVLPLDGA